ncbi:hypothetical protein B0H13DRAFT_2543625 [Mycena leptocephala]|nr:hypothetical protein B0H13DRAFT_2543625 [Mycena leptocephala]
MLPFTLLCLLSCSLVDSTPVPALQQRILTSLRKPNVTQSRGDLIAIASAALKKAIDGASRVSQFNGQTYEVFGTLYEEMAEFDAIENQTQYEDTLQQEFSATQQTRANFNDTQTYGYAAVRAYMAYQNQVFLQYAIQSWSFGRMYTLSSTGGNLALKNFVVEESCSNGATMAGGTFLTTTPSDPSVTAMSTGYFMLLSALLAEATEATPDPKYLDAAKESAAFIQTQLYNGDHLVFQSISASQNDSCKVLNDAVNSFNSGLFIEGLAVLVSITQDATTQNTLDNVITAVLANPDWQTSGGIIANGAGKDGDSILIRALAAAYVRNVTSPDIHANLHDYLGVQFNAVMDFATNGDNVYANQWIGPPSSSFALDNQTNALAALLSATYLSASTVNTTTTSTTPSASGSASGSTSMPSSTIAGIVVAGLFFLALVIITYIIMRRRHAQGRPLSWRQRPPAPPPSVSSMQPFVNPAFVSATAGTSDGTHALGDPSFAHPSDRSVAHPNNPRPAPVSYPPEKRRPLPRRPPSPVSGTLIPTSPSESSFAGGTDPYSVMSVRGSRLLGEGEEPPPEYAAMGK